MSWFHRITFRAMYAAVWLLKDKCVRMHQAASTESDPAKRKQMHAEADAIDLQAEGLRQAYHERQQGRPNRD